MALSDEQVRKILDRFDERAPNAKCPLCGNERFLVADGFAHIVLNDDPQKIGKVERGIPSFPIVCNNCGFVAHIATRALGIDSEGEDKEGGASAD